MDAINDLIVGTAIAQGWPDIELYANSISRTGFKGKKVLFVEDLTTEAVTRLQQLGFELLDLNAGAFPRYDPTNKWATVGTARFRPVYEYLEEHKDVRYVFWTDVRDVVYQTDPSVWMEGHQAPLVIGSECIAIKNEPGNAQWVRNAFDDETYEKVKEFDVLNSGTFAGMAYVVKEFCKAIYEISSAAPVLPVDQGVVCVLPHKLTYGGLTYIPRMSDGFAAVVSSFLWLGPTKEQRKYAGKFTDICPELREGIAYPAGQTTPFVILHQYNRDPRWYMEVNNLYSNNKITEDEALRLFYGKQFEPKRLPRRLGRN
jgi:hypothetical protein